VNPAFTDGLTEEEPIVSQTEAKSKPVSQRFIAKYVYCSLFLFVSFFSNVLRDSKNLVNHRFSLNIFYFLEFLQHLAEMGLKEGRAMARVNCKRGKAYYFTFRPMPLSLGVPRKAQTFIPPFHGYLWERGPKEKK